jgi:hypothetical protein
MSYSFTYAALAEYYLNFLCVNGGKYGCAIPSHQRGLTGNSTLDNDGVAAELDNITLFKQQVLDLVLSGDYTNIVYDGTTNLTMTPIGNKTWYTFPSTQNLTPRVITFDTGGDPDAVFYIFNSLSNLVLSNYTFRLGDAKAQNIYIIADGTIIMYDRLPYYGNFIASSYTIYDMVTINGTATALGDSLNTVNGILTHSGTSADFFMVINFPVETYVFSADELSATKTYVGTDPTNPKNFTYLAHSSLVRNNRVVGRVDTTNRVTTMRRRRIVSAETTIKINDLILTVPFSYTSLNSDSLLLPVTSTSVSCTLPMQYQVSIVPSGTLLYLSLYPIYNVANNTSDAPP